MKLQMRELRGDDLFILLSILSKLDIKDDLITMFEGATHSLTVERIEELKKKHKNEEELKKAFQAELEKAIENRGMRIVANLIVKVMASIGTAKEEINTLLAQLCDVSVKEIKALKLAEYTQLVVAFFKKPELKDFLESIKPLLQSESQEATSETANT